MNYFQDGDQCMSLPKRYIVKLKHQPRVLPEDDVEMDRLFKVAVLGGADVPEESETGRKAWRIGHAVAHGEAILLTGGCGGLPHAALVGARDADGISVAISPASNMGEHTAVYSYPVDSLVIVYTGMGRKGRNVVLVRSADACILVGGGMGTLNEFTIACDELGPGSAIGVLSQSGGLSDEYLRLVNLVGRQPEALLVVNPEPERLVAEVLSHVRTQAYGDIY